MVNGYFNFRRVDNFQRDFNRKDCFTIDDMNGTDENYKIVLVTECNPDINKCLDEDGTLMDWDSETGYGVKILQTLGERDGLLPLLYNSGINGECSISAAASSVVYELTDSIDYVKGAFLVSYGNGSGYVMAYAINNAPLEVQDEELILMVNGMIWGTQYVIGE